jgi:ABC-2 type transport system permease protein
MTPPTDGRPPRPIPPPSGAAPDGVIHDIGYRGYRGPRLGRGYATRSLFAQSLRAAFGLGRSARAKVLPGLMLAAMLLPAVVMVSFAVRGGGTQLSTDYPQYLHGVGQLFMFIFVAAQAPVLLARDLRHATMPLYLSRPITRGDYVRAKGAAMAAALLIVTVLPLLVLYAGALLDGFAVGHNTLHFGYGLLAALLYALVLSAVGLLIAAATPRRGFGVAAIMGVLVVSGIVASIVSGLQGGLHADSPRSAQWAYLISPASVVERFANQLCGLADGSAVPGTPGLAGTAVFGLELLVIVAGGYLLLLHRYRKI